MTDNDRTHAGLNGNFYEAIEEVLEKELPAMLIVPNPRGRFSFTPLMPRMWWEGMSEDERDHTLAELQSFSEHRHTRWENFLSRQLSLILLPLLVMCALLGTWTGDHRWMETAAILMVTQLAIQCWLYVKEHGLPFT